MLSASAIIAICIPSTQKIDFVDCSHCHLVATQGPKGLHSVPSPARKHVVKVMHFKTPDSGPMGRHNCHGITISTHPSLVTALLNNLKDRSKNHACSFMFWLPHYQVGYDITLQRLPLASTSKG